MCEARQLAWKFHGDNNAAARMCIKRVKFDQLRIIDCVTRQTANKPPVADHEGFLPVFGLRLRMTKVNAALIKLFFALNWRRPPLSVDMIEVQVRPLIAQFGSRCADITRESRAFADTRVDMYRQAKTLGDDRCGLQCTRIRACEEFVLSVGPRDTAPRPPPVFGRHPLALGLECRGRRGFSYKPR